MEGANEIEILDPFVNQPEVLEHANPFFLPLDGSTLKYTKTKFLVDEYKHVYIMCLVNTFEPTTENKNRIKLFHCKDANITQLKEQSELVVLVRAPFSLIQQQSIRSGLVVVGKNLLEFFNHQSYELNNKELVYLMLETTEKRVRKWLEIYDSESNLDEFIEQKIFTSYYQLSDKKINDHLLNLIGKVWDFKYWCDEKNCMININNAFSNRKFNLAFSIKIKVLSDTELDKELQEILKSFETKGKNIEYYPYQITNPKEDEFIKMATYVDASKAENRGFYPLTEHNNLSISMESIEELLTNNSLNEKEKYYLVCNLLPSRKYCHYIINNSKILDAIGGIIEKYKPIFRYLIGYAWISLYMEESIRKTRTKQIDSFVFNLDTASKLPFFPFSPLAPNLNPYFCLLVADNIANYANNVLSVEQSLDYQHGIVNLEEFRKRLNLFISGNASKNLLEGVDWSNMVITGGTMAALLPKTNPLMALFSKNKDKITDQELDRFFQEYYSKSDIDIACNFSDIIDFIEHVKHIKKIIHKNLGDDIRESEINIVPIKTLIIYVNAKMLKQKCETGEIPFKYDYIIKNKNEQDIKLHFYEMYLSIKIQSNKKNMTILGEKAKDDEYFEILNFCSTDKTTIIINEHQFETDVPSFKLPELNSGIEMVYLVKNNNQTTTIREELDNDEQNNDVFIKFVEGLKYKINSKHLRHSFEIFRIAEKEFFSCIARFHLPCVRSYYNGHNCYMLPSAVTAYQTLVNIDFKYFVGSHDPISIIDKYRKRGYGTILNNYEIGQYLFYIAGNRQYCKAYCLDNIKEINKILGPLSINHGYFKPRQTLPEEFTLDPKIPISYQSITNYKPLASKNDILDYYKKTYPKYPSELIDKRTISSTGKIEPIKHWMIEASYDLLQ